MNAADLFPTEPVPAPAPGPDPAAPGAMLLDRMAELATMGDQLRAIRPDMAPLGGVPMIPDEIVSMIADAAISSLFRLQGQAGVNQSLDPYRDLKPGDMNPMGDGWVADMLAAGMPYELLNPYFSANVPPEARPGPVMQEFKESVARPVPDTGVLTNPVTPAPTALERLAQREFNPAAGMSPDAALRRLAAPQPKAAPFSPFG